MVNFNMNMNKNIIQYFETTEEENSDTQEDSKLDNSGLGERAKNIQETAKQELKNIMDKDLK